MATWSNHFDEFKGYPVNDSIKGEIRRRLLPLLQNPDRRLRVASAYNVSKIASAGMMIGYSWDEQR